MNIKSVDFEKSINIKDINTKETLTPKNEFEKLLNKATDIINNESANKFKEISEKEGTEGDWNSMLIQLLSTGKLSVEDVEKFSEILNSETSINGLELLKPLLSSQDKMLTSLISTDAKSDIVKALMTSDNLEIPSDIFQEMPEVENVIATAAQNRVVQSSGFIQIDFEEIKPKIENLKEIVIVRNKDNSPKSNQAETEEFESKEVKILKGIINSDDKTENRGLSLPFHLNRLKDASISVKETSNITKVNSNNMANDVVRVIKYMDANSIKEMTVKVNPEELGELVIKITMEGNAIKANISATNKDTYSLLNSSAADIKNGLNSSNIVIQDVSINIYNGDTTFFSSSFEGNGQQFKQQNGNASNPDSSMKAEDIDIIDKEQKRDLIDSSLSILA
jgi:flagellar hook-length control protein FliK